MCSTPVTYCLSPQAHECLVSCRIPSTWLHLAHKRCLVSIVLMDCPRFSSQSSHGPYLQEHKPAEPGSVSRAVPSVSLLSAECVTLCGCLLAECESLERQTLWRESSHRQPWGWSFSRLSWKLESPRDSRGMQTTKLEECWSG